jgi:hypothetical protein
MKNIVDYARDEKRSFKDYAFNDVDSLILSTMCYLDFSDLISGLDDKPGIILKKFSIEKLNERIKNQNDNKLYINLMNNLINNPRFNDLILNNYVDITDYNTVSHFCAMTFSNDYFTYIAYMGTSASLIDWKEDFNMAYMCPVPAQKSALKYLNAIMEKTKGLIYVGGHSKGGNLAIYSSINTYIWNKLRIKKIYTHDGPGFTKKIFKSLNYRLMKNKISKTVPSSSVVGMLLYSLESYNVVKSNTIGLMQHSSFTWQINDSKFVFLKSRAWDSAYFDKTISDWLNSVSDEEKGLFVNTMYDILSQVDFSKIDVSKNNWWNLYKTIKIGKAKLDPETRHKLDQIFKKLTYYERINLLSIKE